MATGYEQLALDRQLCFALYAASRAVVRRYGPLLERAGLTYPQYLTLLVLWEDPDRPRTVGELGARLQLDSGTLTPLLKRMEQKQWLSRRRDPRDERSVIIALLPAGRALEAQAQQIPLQMLDKMQLSEAEILSLRTHLTHLLTQLA
jgi:DNA-binding MarR family transcriptional regulator